MKQKLKRSNWAEMVDLFAVVVFVVVLFFSLGLLPKAPAATADVRGSVLVTLENCQPQTAILEFRDVAVGDTAITFSFGCEE